MKGLILAAGRGQRLGQIGESIPKCLIELDGRSLLHWQRDSMQAAGVREFAIVGGYREKQLPSDSYTTFSNPNWASTGVVASLLTAKSWLETGTTLVSYGDIIYEPDIVRAIRNMKGDISISSYTHWRELWSARFADPLTDAETFKVDGTGRLLEIGHKPRTMDDVQGQFMGLAKFTPSGFAQVHAFMARHRNDLRQLDMTGLLAKLIERSVKIQTQPVKGLWFEVDNETDISLYQDWVNRVNSAEDLG